MLTVLIGLYTFMRRKHNGMWTFEKTTVTLFVFSSCLPQTEIFCTAIYSLLKMGYKVAHSELRSWTAAIYSSYLTENTVCFQSRNVSFSSGSKWRFIRGQNWIFICKITNANNVINTVNVTIEEQQCVFCAFMRYMSLTNAFVEILCRRESVKCPVFLPDCN